MWACAFTPSLGGDAEVLTCLRTPGTPRLRGACGGSQRWSRCPQAWARPLSALRSPEVPACLRLCPRRGGGGPRTPPPASQEPPMRPGGTQAACPAFPSLPFPSFTSPPPSPSGNGRHEPDRWTGAAFPLPSSSSLAPLRLQPRPGGRERDPAARRGHHWGELPTG